MYQRARQQGAAGSVRHHSQGRYLGRPLCQWTAAAPPAAHNAKVDQ
jgi:hypothetical protein